LVSLPLVVVADVLVLAINGRRCPLTCMSARFRNERRENFDILLPMWLAKRDKLIFGALYFVGVLFAFRGCGYPRSRPPNVTGR
jgi:hypothetical protein